MQFNLVPHPSTPPADPAFKVWVKVDHAGSRGAAASTNIRFGIGAPTSRFVVPGPVEEPTRAENLWQTTCFEAFVRTVNEEGYREWNFAPSSEWEAYDFTGYRDGRREADVVPPDVRVEDNRTWWALGATIGVDAAAWQLGLSAILEERDGTKSYWAIAHPECDKPDFHDPACFAAHLP